MGINMNTELGFGCAPILGRVNKSQSLCALDLAIKEGIDYFDIARSYGWGEAESLLGKFVSTNNIARDSIQITTKFGLNPQNNRLLKISKAIARKVLTTIPQSQKMIKVTASKVAPKPNFTLNNAKLSLETSLKALCTDYIDYLLIHEFNFTNYREFDLEIIHFLNEQKRSGIIKNFGYSVGDSLDLFFEFIETTELVPGLIQIPCGLAPHYRNMLSKFREKGTKIVFHSPFRSISSNEEFNLYLDERLDKFALLDDIKFQMNYELDESQLISVVLLCYFKARYLPYKIIASMFSQEHIFINQKAVNKINLTEEQISIVDQFFNASSVF